MSTLHLIRHGQASAGTHDYDRLSPLGERQAQLLGQWWAKQGFNPDQASHGSLLRQRETARLALESLAPAKPAKEHAGLNEYDHRVIDSLFGGGAKSDDPESLTFEDYVNIMLRWRDTHPDELSQETESWTDFVNRGWRTVRDLHSLAADDHHHVYFTSGGIIATLVSTVLNLDFQHTVDAIWRIRNTSITTLHFDGTHARLIDFNTVPHLQAHHDHSLITLI